MASPDRCATPATSATALSDERWLKRAWRAWMIQSEIGLAAYRYKCRLTGVRSAKAQKSTIGKNMI